MKKMTGSIILSIITTACGGGGGSTSTGITQPIREEPVEPPPSTTTRLATKADMLGLWDATRVINGNTDVLYVEFFDGEYYSYDYMKDPYATATNAVYKGRDCYVQRRDPIAYNSAGSIRVYNSTQQQWYTSGAVTITGTRLKVDGLPALLGIPVTLNKTGLSSTSFSQCP